MVWNKDIFLQIIWLYFYYQQDEEQIDKLKKELVTPLLLLDVFSWLLIGLGIALTAVGSVLFICKKWFPVQSIKEIFQLNPFAYPTLFQWQSTKPHISLGLMTCSFSMRLVCLVLSKAFCHGEQKEEISIVFFCTHVQVQTQCWCPVVELDCPCMTCPGQRLCPVSGPVTITWDRKNVIRDMLASNYPYPTLSENIASWSYWSDILISDQTICHLQLCFEYSGV